MAKKPTKSRNLSLYSNLTHRRRTRKDAAARKRAEYLASLPKHPIKRMLYRLHPKRFWGYWFSRRGLLTVLKVAGVAILLGILGVGALFAYYRRDLDSIQLGQISKRVQTTVTKYYARDGKTLLWEDTGGGNYTLTVPGDKISKYMKDATVAIEDKDFYKHNGVSFSGIMRAAVNNAGGGSTQGGSTLTQQLVKQVFLAGEAEQRGVAGIPRKIKEVILSIEVERRYDKQTILNLYLNESPYGGPRNGVESGAQAYFGKPASKLTIAESALLASIPQSPSLFDPYNTAGHERLIARQQQTITNMVEQGYITKGEGDAAKKINILDRIKPQVRADANIKAPHFVMMARSQLEQKLGKATVGNGGLTVITTLEPKIQSELEKQMKSMFEQPSPRCGYQVCPNYAGFSNGAAAVEDTKTGQIIALMGSRDYRYPGFGQDNAATAFIQPGSSIKPLVYAQLFQNQGAGKQNFGSGSILSDSATTFPGGYRPQNADGRFRQNIPIRLALAESRNIPAIKAMAVAGKDPTWKTIRDMGDVDYCTQGPDAQAGLSSAIGGCGSRLVDHNNAIASLGRMGTYKPWSVILEAKNSSGDVVMKYKNESKSVIDPQSAYIVTDILADSNARRRLTGSINIVQNLEAAGIKAAVKTGTSNAEVNGTVVAKDIWTVGYTPNLSMSVWLGNSDTTPLTNGNSTIPALIFDPVMARASEVYQEQGKGKISDWFTEPGGIQNIRGELYPSWYNRSQSTSNSKMTFDKVSKKKATNCTPPEARIEIDVTETTDPFTKKKIARAPDGYDANAEDDFHKCDDVKPTVPSISIESAGGDNYRIAVTAQRGTNPLREVQIAVDGRVVATLPARDSGSYPTTTRLSGNQTITVKVIDEGYYTGSGSRSYSASGSSDSDNGAGRGRPFRGR